MQRKILKWILGVVISLGLVALIAFNLLVVWVATGPRSLKASIPYIESQISKVQNRFVVKIDDGILFWDGWQKPFDLRFKNVSVATTDGVVFAKFPEVSVGADITALFTGRFMPNSVKIDKPTIVLERMADGTVSFGFGQEYKAKISTPEHPFVSPDDTVADYGLKEALSFLDEVTIAKATISVSDYSSGKNIVVNDASIIAQRHFYNISLALKATVNYDESLGSFYVEATVPLTSMAADIKANLTRINPGVFTIVSSDFAELEGIKTPVNAVIALKLDDDGQPENGNARLAIGKGEIYHKFFETPLFVDKATADLSFAAGNVFTLNSLSLVSLERNFIAKGKMWQSAEGTGISLGAQAVNIKMEDIRQFWPPHLAPVSREWVSSNVGGGVVPQAKLAVNIKPGDLSRERLPKEAIQSNISFTGGQVRYKPEHPKVLDAKGIVKISASDLAINIESAKYMDKTTLSSGIVAIDDLLADNPRINVSFDTISDASDIARFLALPDMKIASILNITQETLSGKISGKGKVGFNYYAPRDDAGEIIESKVADYEISGQLSDVETSGLLNRFDLKSVNGEMRVTNDEIDFIGTVKAFSSPLNIDLKHYLSPKSGVETELNFSGVVDESTVEKLGFAIADKIKGALAINAKVTRAEEKTKTEAVLDLLNADVELKDLNWRKMSGVSAKLEFTSIEDSSDIVEIPNFSFVGKDIVASGGASFDAKNNKLVSLVAENFLLGRNNLRIVYQPIDGGYKISANGVSADLKNYLEKEEESTSLQKFPALDLTLDVATVYLAHDVVASGVKGSVLCDISRCNTANISGTTDGGKSFSLKIDKNANRRSFLAKSEDAGVFLKGFNIYKNMIDGVLYIDGNYADTKTQAGALSGEIIINEFRIRNAGALAKVLTLASFTGLMDTLQGNEGIEFDRMRGKYTLVNDVIKVKDLKSIGSALGIIVDGEVGINSRTISLKGTAIPSYTINSALKNVPIVGEILTGGEGIIAAVFTVKGQSKDPEVSVNPLSVLAPGFLRNIFE